MSVCVYWYSIQCIQSMHLSHIPLYVCAMCILNPLRTRRATLQTWSVILLFNFTQKQIIKKIVVHIILSPFEFYWTVNIWWILNWSATPVCDLCHFESFVTECVCVRIDFICQLFDIRVQKSLKCIYFACKSIENTSDIAHERNWSRVSVNHILTQTFWTNNRFKFHTNRIS